jgi:hypothetical protein
LKGSEGLTRVQEVAVKALEKTTLIAVEAGCTEQLAQFFPQCRRIQIPAEVTAIRAGGKRLQERVMLEFGEKGHAIFRSELPIEFNDRVSVALKGDGSNAEGSVIAVQYHEGCKAVAVRFTNGSRNWMTQR